ncbi:hypothetical protein CARUB_v10010480mg, partial [Capsella rubella]
GNLTTRCSQVHLKLLPHTVKMLIVSPEFNCSNEMLSVSLPHSMHLLLPLPLTSSVINTNSFSALSGLERLKEQQMLGLDTLMIVYNAFKQNIHEDPNWCCENLHQNLQAMLDSKLVRIMSRFNLKRCSTHFNYYINVSKTSLRAH